MLTNSPLTSVVLSGIDPNDWPCFGTVNLEHPDCQACPFVEPCKEKKEGK